ncbi:hypothetical protein [Chitinophaga pinensis]|uniref:EF-hand domain-containing protein n=1 Tax=Chitinophaga pinensis (strain ATCC 43595 / DSM 2588 / LMG 13176 / NBRC 15968 / NCIMB 11800 / UQM 2034) TaxID=485918 RepID=A0A979GWY3_CHIPD|nr:hypothetical protein [Chitinophaga pinensis]ACU60815.1 hypothetical protein Cpin_3348 [Chitinophaga pinensis DSM 2588]
MLEQLTQLIQQSGLQSVINNPEVPNEHNDGVIAEAQNTILSTFSQLQANGETQQVNEALESADHPVTQNIQQNFAGNIMEKFGINGSTAASIAAVLIPTVLNAMKGGQQGGGAGNGFNIQDILSSLGGGNLAGGLGNLGGGNIQNTINNIGGKFGLDKDGDGDVDLNDLTKMFR